MNRSSSTMHSALEIAVNWITGTLLGSFATALAIIAVAVVGLAMMAGRIDFRRALSVIMGCFILFGASAIGQAIVKIVDMEDQGAVSSYSDNSPVTSVVEPRLPPARSRQQFDTDPYAGAAVQR